MLRVVVISTVLQICALLISLPSAAAPYRDLGTDWRLPKAALEHRAVVRSELGDLDFSLGNFILRWRSAQAQLQIESLASPGRSLWSTLPGYAFVRAAKGLAQVSQWRGSFNILDSAGERQCYRQTIASMQLDGGDLRIKGWIDGQHCNLRYELVFKPLSVQRLGFELSFFDAAGRLVGEDVINRTALVYASRAAEHFYGFGEQFSHFDLKGRLVPIFAQEQGHLRGSGGTMSTILNQISPGAAGSWHTTYTAVPFYVTSDRRGLLLDHTEYLFFDLRQEHRVEARVWAARMQGQLLAGETPPDLIKAYTEVSGRMPALPDWFHRGAIVGLMGGEGVIRDIHHKLSERQTPIAAYWIQDWVGKRQTGLGVRMWWNWELDEQSYPNWHALSQDLAAQGIRTLGYINPFLSDVSSKPGVRRNLYAEAAELGYLVTKADGTPYAINSGGFSGTLVDLSNPAARQWLKTYLNTVLGDAGFSGWMADFSEALPFDAVLQSGESAARFHNQYPVEWARLNRELIEENGKLGDSVFFVRSAGLRSPGFATLFWLGDQMTSWDAHDGLKSAIIGVLSGGLSGLALNHGDIGGLIGMQRKFLGYRFLDIHRDRELMQRWLEMAAFTGVFRTHEGNNPGINHQFYSDDVTLDAFAYFAKVFATLFAYRQSLNQEAAATGLPLQRHPWLHYPDDPNVQNLRYQFLLGRDFMVAPVTDPGVTQAQVYLPAGRWIELWNGRAHTSRGDWLLVPAPLGYPPVFFREESSEAWQISARIRQLPRPKSLSLD